MPRDVLDSMERTRRPEPREHRATLDFTAMAGSQCTVCGKSAAGKEGLCDPCRPLFGAEGWATVAPAPSKAARGRGERREAEAMEAAIARPALTLPPARPVASGHTARQPLPTAGKPAATEALREYIRSNPGASWLTIRDALRGTFATTSKDPDLVLYSARKRLEIDRKEVRCIDGGYYLRDSLPAATRDEVQDAA